MTTSVEIPKRAAFKATEVCSIVGVQPYVLKSWEAEFPALAKTTTRKGTRIYGRSQVELALRIKHLLFVDGLTLGAARRQIHGEEPDPESDESLPLEELVDEGVRDGLAAIRRGLESVLAIVSENGQPVAAPAKRKTRRAARGSGTSGSSGRQRTSS